MPSTLVGDGGIVVIWLSPRVRTRQVMQKAFIKETYYCTILNWAPAKLAPVSMAQLSTRGSRTLGKRPGDVTEHESAEFGFTQWYHTQIN